MLKRIILLIFGLIMGLSSMAYASHVGIEIALSGLYGPSSWDGSSNELWNVLANANYTALAADVLLDIGPGTPSTNYRVYRNSYWTAPGYDTKLVAEVADYAPNNSFGWYEKSSPATGQIFAGANVPGNTATFFNPNEIGFWLNPNGVTDLYYYTDISLNDGDLQAVTFYLGNYYGYGDEYLVCFEDLDYSSYPCGCDRDFQDMIVWVHPVPEPASLSLLGFGLLGLLGIKRKRS